MDNISLREYRTEDNQFVSTGLNHIEEIEKEALTSLDLQKNFSEQINQWLTSINSQPSTLTVIAELNNIPCGFIIGVVQPQPNNFTAYSHHGIIQAIWVEPELYNKGIGSSLVNEMLGSFAEFKIAYCDIAYHPNNLPAKKFWKKLGFNDAQITARKFL